MKVISSSGQKPITPDDFRLCLDNLACSDSTLKITKEQLLNAKTITPNFSWFTITQLTFYFSPEFGMDVTAETCTGDSFCDKIRPLLERCGPGATLMISAEGINKSGKKIQWSDMRLKIIK